jgi:hypothetical protein
MPAGATRQRCGRVLSVEDLPRQGGLKAGSSEAAGMFSRPEERILFCWPTAGQILANFLLQTASLLARSLLRRNLAKPLRRDGAEGRPPGQRGIRNSQIHKMADNVHHAPVFAFKLVKIGNLDLNDEHRRA